MTNLSINIQQTRPCLWYRTFGVINCVYAKFDDLNMAISHINQWGKSRYFYRSPSRMKTTAVVFISPPGVNSVIWMMTVTTTLPPLGDHADAWASMSMVLPSFCLLYATSCASTSCLWIGESFKGGTKVTSSYTETRFSGFRRPLSVQVIFWVAQRWHEGRGPV